MPQSQSTQSPVNSAFPASYFPNTSVLAGGVRVVPPLAPNYVARFDPSGVNTVTTLSVPEGDVISDVPAASYTGDLNALLEYTINNSFTPPRREFSVPTSVTGLPLSVFSPAAYISFYPGTPNPVRIYNISTGGVPFLTMTAADYGGSLAGLDRMSLVGDDVLFSDPNVYAANPFSPALYLGVNLTTGLPERIYPLVNTTVGVLPTQAEARSPLYVKRWVPTLSPVIPGEDYNALWGNAVITAGGSLENFSPAP